MYQADSERRRGGRTERAPGLGDDHRVKKTVFLPLMQQLSDEEEEGGGWGGGGGLMEF